MTVEKNDVVLYNSNDIMKIFKCGKNQAYKIMRANGFPSFRINTKYFIEKASLEKWIDKNMGKKINA